MSDHRIIHGFITRDPETRETKGDSVTDFGVALNRKFKKKDGTSVEEVHFVNAICWGKRGEAIATYLEKGSEFMGWGYMKTDHWEDKEGNKKSKDVMVIEGFDFCGKKDN